MTQSAVPGVSIQQEQKPVVTSGEQPAPKQKPAHDPSVLESILEATDKKYRLSLEPTTFDESTRIASMAARFRLCGVQTADDALSRILLGRAMGLPAMASINHIRMIHNKREDTFTPCISARIKVALCLSRPDIIEYIYPKEMTNESVTWVAKRRNGPEVPYKFTIEDAKIAGLVGRGGDNSDKNNYDRHPMAMMSARASGRLVDIVASDLTNGIGTEEELVSEFRIQDEIDGVKTPERRPAPTQASPERDWSSEVALICHELGQCGTPESLKAILPKITAFAESAPKEHADTLRAAYRKVSGQVRGG